MMCLEEMNCPVCGEKCLSFGQYGDHLVNDDYHVTCDNCDFYCPDGSCDIGEARIAFEDYIKSDKFKSDYLTEKPTCENCILYDLCFPVANKNREHGYSAFKDGKMLPLCTFKYNNERVLFLSRDEYTISKKNT